MIEMFQNFYLFTKIPIDEIKKLSILKNKEINEAKKILAFEVTKIVRGEKAAKEAREISDNLFTSKINDSRAKNYTINSDDIDKESFNLIDAVQKLGLVESRSEIKRLIKSNGIKINEEVYKEKNYSLKKFVYNQEIKISVGKKKIGLLKFSKTK